ncbi:hypothetical protein DFH28DRAFT_1094667 [Melampsora americana]|nr:hypothetical protein DFH28DRAFT_1094667 [Melampsora americana]
MSNLSSTNSAAITLIGPVNNLFESPDDGVGDDWRAICTRHNPLYRVGTPAREMFDLNHQMTIEVRFKIYTNQEVDVDNPSQATPKVGAGKKPAKVAKLNLIDYKAIAPGYLEIKTCLFGKSLNDFKKLVAESCEDYESGMQQILLEGVLSPTLKWKTTVGRVKQVLEDADKWQAFVDALEKSTKKQGILSIENGNVKVKSKDDSKESATKKLIARTNGREPEDQDSEESKKEVELKGLACKVFSQHGLEGYAGGDASWIWAKGIMANIASIYIPLNTPKFREEIKKTQWIHPDMDVNHRVKTRLQGHPRRLHEVFHHEGTSNSNQHSHVGGLGLMEKASNLHQSTSDSSLCIDRKPDLTNSGEKRSLIDLDAMIDIKPDIKKIKTEDCKSEFHPNEKELKWDDDSYLDDNVMKRRNDSESEIDHEISLSGHAVKLENFLLECDIPHEDSKTRKLLQEAGISSWTDLIPSVQLTESVLTSYGIDRHIATQLMEEAQLRYWDCK